MAIKLSEKSSRAVQQLVGEKIILTVREIHTTDGILAFIRIRGDEYFFLIHPYYPTHFNDIFKPEDITKVEISSTGVEISVKRTIPSYKEE